MAVLVVDALEEIDVEQRHRERRARALHALVLLADKQHDGAPVPSAGQFVAVGEPLDFGQRDRQLGSLLVEQGTQMSAVLAEECEAREHDRQPQPADGTLRRRRHRQVDAVAEACDDKAHRQGEPGRSKHDAAKLHPQRAEREDNEGQHQQRHADLRRPQQEDRKQRAVRDHLLHDHVVVAKTFGKFAVEDEMEGRADEQSGHQEHRRHAPGQRSDEAKAQQKRGVDDVAGRHHRQHAPALFAAHAHRVGRARARRPRRRRLRCRGNFHGISIGLRSRYRQTRNRLERTGRDRLRGPKDRGLRRCCSVPRCRPRRRA